MQIKKLIREELTALTQSISRRNAVLVGKQKSRQHQMGAKTIQNKKEGESL